MFKIKIKMDVAGKILVTVADNGCGMNESNLIRGMTYGARGSDSPSRLGKFGLGLKTASTAFCRKLSLISRDKSNKELVKATWDLAHVTKVGKWEIILSSVNKYEKEIFEEVAAGSSGTLVVWDEVDKIIITD